MRKIRWQALFQTVGSVALSLLATATAYGAPCVNTTSCTERVEIGDGKKFQIHRTYSLFGAHPEVKRAVIVIHGTSQNPGSYFGSVIQAGDALGVTSESMIIAPFMKEAENNPASDDLYWSTSWRTGNDSINSGTKFSSYDVTDFLLLQLKDRGRFPNLQQITVLGHSAGGQYVQRYAIGTTATNDMPGYRIDFVPANPSYFAFIDNRRPRLPSVTDFYVPSGSCSSFNSWGAGLDNRNRYMSRLSTSSLIAQYLKRHVVYLSGTADTVRDSNLVVTCSADAQGLNRYQRAQAISNHIEQFYPENNHEFVPVAGVGHTAGGMFRSTTGRRVIFPVLDGNPVPTPTPSPSATPSPSPTPMPVSKTLRVQITSSSDDAEQLLTGQMYVTSPDLEFILNSGREQMAGLRFRGISVPKGAVIEEAYLEITVEEATSVATSLTFYGQKSLSASAFGSTSNNISNRPLTSSAVSWTSVPAWSTSGAIQRTPNLGAIVQEIVNQSSWVSGNALAIIVKGSGNRVGYSYDGSASRAPVLVIRYR